MSDEEMEMAKLRILMDATATLLSGMLVQSARDDGTRDKLIKLAADDALTMYNHLRERV